MKEKTKRNIEGLLMQLRATHKWFNGREMAALIEQALEHEYENDSADDKDTDVEFLSDIGS